MPGSWPAVDRDAVASSEAIEEQFDALVESNDLILETVVSLKKSMVECVLCECIILVSIILVPNYYVY